MSLGVHMELAAKQQAPTHALCTLPEIMGRAKISKSAVYSWIAQGKFPKPFLVLGPRYTRWSVQEIDQWMADPAAWIAAHTQGVAA